MPSFSFLPFLPEHAERASYIHHRCFDDGWPASDFETLLSCPARFGIFAEPVARRSGGNLGDLLFRAAVQLMRIFDVSPTVRTGDDSVVPNTVVGVFFAFEIDAVALLSGIFDMHGTVEIAHEMDDAAQAHDDRRIVLRLVVLQFGNGVFECEDHVAALGIGYVIEVFVNGCRMPYGGVFVSRFRTPFVHPGCIVNDRMSEILLDGFLGFGRKVALGDVGDGVVSHLSPPEGGVAAQHQRCGDQKQVPFHKFEALIGNSFLNKGKEKIL